MKRFLLLSVCAVGLMACSDETASGRAGQNNAPANNGAVAAADEVAVCGVECLGGEPLCDAERRVCVECTADSHCGVAEPACDSRGECRECVSDSHCFGDRPVCDSAEGECVAACTADADCADRDGGFRFCEASSGHCLQCRDAADCTDGDRPLCAADGRCVECEDNSACGGDSPFCDASRGRCRECLVDADCGSGACVDFECAECATDEDCPVAAPICDLQERNCVICVGNADCPAETPLCDDGDACVQCLEDEDCDAGLQCQDGVCAPD